MLVGDFMSVTNGVVEYRDFCVIDQSVQLIPCLCAKHSNKFGYFALSDASENLASRLTDIRG
jgi:hypothetical protein